MEKIVNFLKILIHSSIYLSIGAGIVSIATGIISNLLIENDMFYLFFIPFSASFFVYNFNRITDKKEDLINIPERVYFIKKHCYWY